MPEMGQMGHLGAQNQQSCTWSQAVKTDVNWLF